MKTINIKGKEYVPVNERILEFHKLYKDGMIETEIISHNEGVIVMKAVVYPEGKGEGKRYFTGHASEYQADKSSFVNEVSYVENCETSAIGRALGLLGIGIETAFASANEVKAAENREMLNKGLKCEKCGSPITYAEATYSERNYLVRYCRKCQRELAKKNEPF
jgi:hypothetical protein